MRGGYLLFRKRGIKDMLTHVVALTLAIMPVSPSLVEESPKVFVKKYLEWRDQTFREEAKFFTSEAASRYLKMVLPERMIGNVKIEGNTAGVEILEKGFPSDKWQPVYFILEQTPEGWKIDDIRMWCGVCKGTGRCSVCKGIGYWLPSLSCPFCEGTGRCPCCNGRGWVSVINPVAFPFALVGSW